MQTSAGSSWNSSSEPGGLPRTPASSTSSRRSPTCPMGPASRLRPAWHAGPLRSPQLAAREVPEVPPLRPAPQRLPNLLTRPGDCHRRPRRSALPHPRPMDVPRTARRCVRPAGVCAGRAAAALPALDTRRRAPHRRDQPRCRIRQSLERRGRLAERDRGADGEAERGRAGHLRRDAVVRLPRSRSSGVRVDRASADHSRAGT